MQEDHVQEDHMAWYLSGDKLPKYWEVFSFSNLFTTVFHVGGKWDYRKMFLSFMYHLARGNILRFLGVRSVEKVSHMVANYNRESDAIDLISKRIFCFCFQNSIKAISKQLNLKLFFR